MQPKALNGWDLRREQSMDVLALVLFRPRWRVAEDNQSEERDVLQPPGTQLIIGQPIEVGHPSNPFDIHRTSRKDGRAGAGRDVDGGGNHGQLVHGGSGRSSAGAGV